MSTAPPPEQPDERPAGESSSASDEQWEASLRDALEGGGDASAPKEPSARARMVTARLRQQDETAARGRRGRPWRKKKDAEPWQPEGWRTGPAWQEMHGGRRRRGNWLAGVVAVGLVAWGATAYLKGEGFGPDLADGPATVLPAETATPSSAPAADNFPDRPTLDEPFAGSPAEAWGGGAAAIKLPEARAVGGVDAGQVRAGLRAVKKFLVASNLQPEVVAGGKPTEAIAMVDPGHTELRTMMRTAVEKPTRENDATAWFSRFDPAEARLVGDVVKVRGRMELAEAGAGKALITADYSFVYPVENVKQPGEVTRTVVRRVLKAEVVDPAQWQAAAGKIWPREYMRDIGNSACESDDGLLHPQFPSELLGSDRSPSGPTVDPYDRSKSLDELDELQDGQCGSVTRT